MENKSCCVCDRESHVVGCGTRKFNIKNTDKYSELCKCCIFLLHQKLIFDAKKDIENIKYLYNLFSYVFSLTNVEDYKEVGKVIYP